MRYESGFPDMVLIDSADENKRIAVDVMIFGEISPFLMSLSFSLEKFTPIALENGYNKLMIFIVLKPILIMPAILEDIKRIKQNFESNELKIELILGRVTNDDFVISTLI